MANAPLLAWTDGAFLAAVDAAFDDSRRRSGAYLACQPGCNQCCTGTFAISALDAERLRQGYAELALADPAQCVRLADRIQTSRRRLAGTYPGDPTSGELFEDQLSQEIFEEYGNDEVCPVLNPHTGTCDLYAARPMTCRVFGPPVRTDDGLGICELCFVGASEQEVEAGEMLLPPQQIEDSLTVPLGSARTIVAFAFTLPEIS